jgi:hypothetical protein
VQAGGGARPARGLRVLLVLLEPVRQTRRQVG